MWFEYDIFKKNEIYSIRIKIEKELFFFIIILLLVKFGIIICPQIFSSEFCYIYFYIYLYFAQQLSSQKVVYMPLDPEISLQ